eukprot:244018_1
MALFIGSVVLGNTISFTGLYLVFEWLLFVPFCCYHIAQSLSVTHFIIALPLLMVLLYPMSIFSFSTFSMYPLFSYFVHQPSEIGKHQIFHQKVYDYCCDSQTQDEFHSKLIVANYVCIKSYFELLNEDDEDRYCQFAGWLCKQNESSLRLIPLETFRKMANDSYDTTYYTLLTSIRANDWLIQFHPSTLVFAKGWQLFIRILIIIPCLLLDTFYLKRFSNNGQFIRNYGNVISLFGTIVAVLFLLWMIFAICELNGTKWNVFCSNMICSTHKKFVLLSSVDVFIQDCEDIMHSKEKYETYEMDKTKLESANKMLSGHSIEDLPYHNSTGLWQLISTMTIASDIVALSYFVGDCYVGATLGG